MCVVYVCVWVCGCVCVWCVWCACVCVGGAQQQDGSHAEVFNISFIDLYIFIPDSYNFYNNMSTLILFKHPWHDWNLNTNSGCLSCKVAPWSTSFCPRSSFYTSRRNLSQQAKGTGFHSASTSPLLPTFFFSSQTLQKRYGSPWNIRGTWSYSIVQLLSQNLLTVSLTTR